MFISSTSEFAPEREFLKRAMYERNAVTEATDLANVDRPARASAGWRHR